MDPGTGKTAVSLAAICNDAPSLESWSTLSGIVVCPKNIRMNWANEVKKFATLPALATICRGDKIGRIRSLVNALVPVGGEQITIVIMSYGAMVRMMEQLVHVDWDIVILDESQNIAAPGTQRTKKALALRECSRKRMILTGTPIRNTPMDLAPQLEFLGRGCSGFMAHENFKKFHGKWVPGEHGDIFTAVQNLPLLQERLARFVFMISKKEALPYLPERTQDVIEVEMTDEQRDAYKAVAQKLLYESEQEFSLADTDQKRKMSISNVLTKMLRLAHITSGYTTLDGEWDYNGTMTVPPMIKYFEQNPKLDALLELIAEQPRRRENDYLVGVGADLAHATQEI